MQRPSASLAAFSRLMFSRNHSVSQRNTVLFVALRRILKTKTYQSHSHYSISLTIKRLGRVICQHVQKGIAGKKRRRSNRGSHSRVSTDLQYGSSSMVGSKSPAELIMERTIRTINHAMIPKDKTNESAKFMKETSFFICDFRFDYSWTAGTTEEVIYETQVSDAVWIRDRN
ncbi:unnamed protein product [Hymenolepis diminuta]|uniref:Uncharacterized protein n=1 Tax=Hymenolepis diminuta TaxID=6216 RepID=A0A564Y4I4_HYMDI|nr:unnamed protein product [Hymenolepis diminuta]